MTQHTITYDDATQAVEKALRQSYSLGQNYWSQADSESHKQWRKSEETQGKFEALVAQTCAMLALAPQPSTQPQREPDGHLYRYPAASGTRLRLNYGEAVNGTAPIETVPFWFAPPDSTQDREDAERWREVAERFDQSKTSECERVLDALGLNAEDACRTLAQVVDAARAKEAGDD